MNRFQFSMTIILLVITGLFNQAVAQPIPFPRGYTAGNCDCDTTMIIDSTTEISAGQIILQTGMMMATEMKMIVQGSCWQFVNEVYNRSEVGGGKKVIYKTKKSGPYARVSDIEPGDWIYHVNHDYKNVEHSAIFVCWKDIKRKIAITLSYVGMNRKVPARYGEFDLRSVYAIFRPQMPQKPLVMPNIEQSTPVKE